jgi:uncharacterized membrane protein
MDSKAKFLRHPAHPMLIVFPLGLLASVFGLIDWLAIPANTRPKGIGLWHGLGNGLVTALFAISWILRRPMPDQSSGPALTLSFLAC